MKFSELLQEYLDEHDKQISDYYDDRFIGARREGRERMEELADMMDQMVDGKHITASCGS